MASTVDNTTTNDNHHIHVLKSLNCLCPPEIVDPVPDPNGVDSKDVTIDSSKGLAARLYLPPLAAAANKKVPVLVYYHGGGFICPDALAFTKQYHDLLNRVAYEAGVLAVSVNYRLVSLLTGENKLPVAWDDSMDALKWVFTPNADPWLAKHGDFSHVFVAGDSAGANITHNMAMQLEANGVPQVEGLALLCPYFYGSKPVGEESDDFGIMSVGWKAVISPGMTFDDPRINPVADGAPSLAGLGCRKVFVCTGGADPLRWRGHVYVEGVKGSGWEGAVEAKEYDAAGHVFFLNNLDSEEAKDLVARARCGKSHSVRGHAVPSCPIRCPSLDNSFVWLQ